MKEHLKSWLGFMGLLLCFGNAVVLYITFLAAYRNNYTILVTINEYGEAMSEFIIIPITLILGLYGIYRYDKKVYRN